MSIKVYELDFADTNLLSENIKEITAWIESDMHDLEDMNELNYTITIRRMTREQINALPEWE